MRRCLLKTSISIYKAESKHFRYLLKAFYRRLIKSLLDDLIKLILSLSKLLNLVFVRRIFELSKFILIKYDFNTIIDR